jgi:hypothetical protein
MIHVQEFALGLIRGQKKCGYVPQTNSYIRSRSTLEACD